MKTTFVIFMLVSERSVMGQINVKCNIAGYFVYGRTAETSFKALGQSIPDDSVMGGKIAYTSTGGKQTTYGYKERAVLQLVQ